MPSGRKGVTKDYVKQAYQRARRLLGAPIRKAQRQAINNPAIKQFKQSMDLVNKSKKMSKEEKEKTREQIAKSFLDSGLSLKSEIEAKFNKIKPYLNERAKEAIQNDPNMMARYMEANKNQRIAMIAEYYLDSSQFQTAHTRVLGEESDKQNWYEWINEATIDKQLDPSLSNQELNNAIMGYDTIH